MRILLWHVHGSWTTAFVQGAHDYVVPVDAMRSEDGRGRARTWDWPLHVREVPVADLGGLDVDLVLLQRPRDLELVRCWLGREPGRDVPAVHVEHNTPRGDVGDARHHLADRDDIVVAHVTHFNATYWDCGRAPTVVVEHGVVDPGQLWTGELSRIAVVVNEPVRRGRVVGTDLLPSFSEVAPVDVFGMGVSGLGRHLGVAPDRLVEHEDPPQHRLHALMAARRVYCHLARWTSLGLSLVEAMHLGMPVVVLAATEAAEAVAPGAGVISTDLGRLRREADELMHDDARARELGDRARAYALRRFGLTRFLEDWDRLLTEVAA